jgi:hypothetical protein
MNWSNGPVPSSVQAFGSADLEPDVAEHRGDRDRDQRDAEPVAQLVQVLDQRHGPVGVRLAAPTERGLHDGGLS